MTTLAWLVAGVVWAGPVKLTTADGVALAGTSWGSGARGVLLVPDEAGDHAAWSAVGQRMASGGLQVVAIDLRSKGAPLAEADWPKLTADVDAGVAWLLAHGATEVHVVGARFGANLALQAATTNPEIDDLVLLSPALNLHGLRLSASMPGYGPRPLLVETSSEDAMSVKAANWLDSQATGLHELHLRAGAGAGIAMFNKVPDLESTLVGWINSATTQKTALDREVKAGQPGEIETTGTRLEERNR